MGDSTEYARCQYCMGRILEVMIHIHEDVCSQNPDNEELYK